MSWLFWAEFSCMIYCLLSRDGWNIFWPTYFCWKIQFCVNNIKKKKIKVTKIVDLFQDFLKEQQHFCFYLCKLICEFYFRWKILLFFHKLKLFLLTVKKLITWK